MLPFFGPSYKTPKLKTQTHSPSSFDMTMTILYRNQPQHNLHHQRSWESKMVGVSICHLCFAHYFHTQYPDDPRCVVCSIPTLANTNSSVSANPPPKIGIFHAGPDIPFLSFPRHWNRFRGNLQLVRRCSAAKRRRDNNWQTTLRDLTPMRARFAKVNLRWIIE